VSLSQHAVRASISVSDIAEASRFYEEKLGLSAGAVQADDSRIYTCGGGTALHVYESPTDAVRPTATRATWSVPDLEQVVDELSFRGVAFERYDDAILKTDEKGIHELADGRVAWFKDPDGNTFAIEETASTSS
jgi:catechol 2,3-dioxygenase-like lactoylglutathione lyase family enzyme